MLRKNSLCPHCFPNVIGIVCVNTYTHPFLTLKFLENRDSVGCVFLVCKSIIILTGSYVIKSFLELILNSHLQRLNIQPSLPDLLSVSKYPAMSYALSHVSIYWCCVSAGPEWGHRRQPDWPWARFSCSGEPQDQWHSSLQPASLSCPCSLCFTCYSLLSTGRLGWVSACTASLCLLHVSLYSNNNSNTWW